MKKVVLYIILSVLIAVNLWVTMLVVNGSYWATKLNLYLIWVCSILIGVITFIVSRKYKIDKKIDVAILIVTIFSITLLLITGVIACITSSTH